jgi:hypothetical protein
MSDASAALLDGSAWRAFCRRLEAIGEKLQGEGFTSDPRERAEGYRAITRWLAYAMQQEIEAGDPRFPGFVSYQNPWNQWGGPNPDNVYLRANVDPKLAYRVWARDARGLRQAIFSLHEGDMQLSEYGVFGERSLDQLPLARDGGLEIWLSPRGSAPREGHYIELDPRARIFTIRLYQSDWERDALPIFQIERVGAEGEPRPRSIRPRSRQASSAPRAGSRRRSSTGTATRARAGRARRPTSPRPRAARRAAPTTSCTAAASSSSRPTRRCCSRWSGPTPTTGTSSTTRCRGSSRASSTAGSRASRTSRSTSTRMASCAWSSRIGDPGAPNWIDTEGRRRGLLVYRWVWARNNPVPQARVMPQGAVRKALPSDHPRSTPEARREQLARRREAVWNRYR